MLFIKVSLLTANVRGVMLSHKAFMLFKFAFFRWLVIPVCLVGGLVEFVALQRAHFSARKLKTH